ncbi:MAG: hypothetical protein KAS64_02680 [Spirochaetes bacterium]|nr:hypothetical protein [Spirochaetota bacterium]
MRRFIVIFFIIFIAVFVLFSFTDIYAGMNFYKRDISGVMDSLNDSIPADSSTVFSRIFIEEKNNKLKYRYTFAIKIGKNKKDNLYIPMIENSELKVYRFIKNSKKSKLLDKIKSFKNNLKIISIVSLKTTNPGDVILINRYDLLDNRAEFEYLFKPGRIRKGILHIKTRKKLYYLISGIKNIDFKKKGDNYIWKCGPGYKSGESSRCIFVSTLASTRSRISWYKKIYKISKYQKRILYRTAVKLVSGIKGFKKRTARIYEYLLNTSDFLYESFIPRINSGKPVISIKNSADFCRVFINMLRGINLKAVLVIPIQNKGKKNKELPFKIPGVMVKNGEKKRWFFPESRFSHPDYIPPDLQGKSAVTIGKNTIQGLMVIPKRKYANGDIRLWMSIYLRESGDAYFSAYSLFSGRQSLIFRRLINSRSSHNIRRAVFNKILGESFDYRISGIEIKHKRILQFPLSIKFSGTIRNLTKHNQGRYSIKPSLLMRGRFLNGKMLKLIEKGKPLRDFILPSRLYERVTYFLPHGTKLVNKLRNFKSLKRNLRIKQRFRLIKGKKIKKPKHWRKKLWKKWLRFNHSKYKDRIIFYGDVFINWNSSGKEHIFDSLLKCDKQKIKLFLGQY